MKEFSGYNDVKQMVEDIADGDLLNAAGHLAMVLPVGRLAKGGKIIEEGLSHGDEVVDGAKGAKGAEGIKGAKGAADGPGFDPDLSDKIVRGMKRRDWTPEQIEQAVESGEQVRAVNKANGNPATRYIHPETGQSVVVDDVTGEVIHVGGPGFAYGPDSGDIE